jgi:hypothetical protein
MKVIIAGGRDFKDYEKLKKAIEQSGWDITEVVSGCAPGADKLGERWAKENEVPVKPFPAEWDNLKAEGARIKVNKWGKKYNANAGHDRNEQMAVYVGKDGGLIAMDGGSGTNDMKKRAKKHKVPIHEYQMSDEEYDYHF